MKTNRSFVSLPAPGLAMAEQCFEILRGDQIEFMADGSDGDHFCHYVSYLCSHDGSRSCVWQKYVGVNTRDVPSLSILVSLYGP